ncbi:hypothetical protein [Neobacillus niacini]|uniref:hypothetical protein n=1 Tax=Neobacillus niacini TaxID=86668 RepID=UPI0030003936
MSIRFELDYSDVRLLEQKMKRLPDKMEETVNEVLHTDGIEIATEEITKVIPNSQWKNRSLDKAHARTSKWSKSENHNLGFTIKSKGGAAKNRGSFGYLVFPNEGRGPSNPVEQRFMERGMKQATPKIVAKLHEKIDQTLEEAFR